MIVIITVLVIALALLSVNIYVRQSTKKNILTAEEASELDDIDCILVLGAAVKNRTTPSLMLRDRLDKSIELYNNTASPKLLMSGDHSDEYYNEVTVMKNYAIEHNVPSEDVFMDHSGFSTYESIYRAKEIFGADKIIIVTQQYHLYRALYIARSLGIEAYGVATDSAEYNGQRKRDVREFLAINKDFVQALFKPEQPAGEEAISLEGNGDVTN